MRHVLFFFFLIIGTLAYSQGNVPLHNLRHASGPDFIIRSSQNGQAQWIKDTIYFPKVYTVASTPITAKKGDFWRSTANGNTYLWDGVTWQLIAKMDGDTSSINELIQSVIYADGFLNIEDNGGTYTVDLRDTLFGTIDTTGLVALIRNVAPLTDSIAWSNVKNKPLTFTPSTHTHVIGEVTGLQDSLNTRVKGKGLDNQIAFWKNDSLSYSKNLIFKDDSINLKGALNITHPSYTSSYFPINIKTDSIQNQSYPDFKYQVSRFDGVNGVDPKPNIVTRWGYNVGSTPPTGQISLEDASEYYYNLNTSNPAEIVAERHWEFRPLTSSGRPTQRWLTFAGRHDGSYTSFGYVGDMIENRNSNNANVSVLRHYTSNRSLHEFANGLQLKALTNDITIENNLRILGLGNIYNDNDEFINIGKVGNYNSLRINGKSNGDVFRITSPINANQFTHYLWASGYGIRNENTGATYLAMRNSATGRLDLVGSRFGFNNDNPSYTVDVTGDLRISSRSGTATTAAGFDVNGKIVSSDLPTVTASTPLSSSGGINPNITIQNATTSLTGALTSTDWNTFNNKFTLPSLTSGSVLFSNGSTISQDNSNLFWDNTGNKRLGIGTTSPSHRLHLSGTGQAFRFNNATNDGFTVSQINTNEWSWTGLSGGMKFHLQNSDFLVRQGNLGVGTDAPSRMLDVTGEARIRDLTTTTATVIATADATGVLSSSTLGNGLALTSNQLRLNGATIASYATTAAAAADGALTAGSFFKVTNGNGTSALHIKD